MLLSRGYIKKNPKGWTNPKCGWLFKDFETLRIHFKISENEDVIIDRLFDGLSYEIIDVVHLQYFIDIEKLVHKKFIVEQQLKRKIIYKKKGINQRFFTLKGQA